MSVFQKRRHGQTLVRFRHGAWLADCRDRGCWWHVSIKPYPGFLSPRGAWELTLVAAVAHAARGQHGTRPPVRGWE